MTLVINNGKLQLQIQNNVYQIFNAVVAFFRPKKYIKGQAEEREKQHNAMELRHLHPTNTGKLPRKHRTLSIRRAFPASSPNFLARKRPAAAT